MSNRVLCKFFLHGACLKGEFCEFSHDWKDPVNDVCTFYQRGICSYGSRCRYKHVNLSRPQSYASSSSTNYGQSSETVSGGVTPIQGVPTELSASSKPFSPKSKPAWSEVPEHHVILEGGDAVETRSVKRAERPICSFAAAGNCPRGEKCPHIHGDLCPSCGKHCLHPFRHEEREEHMETCEKKQKHLDALKYSQEIECSVCLERVLSKPTAAERKFGLLSECDHPFCISCIRNWRSSSPTSGMDVNSALRACPICRKLSYFVIPSIIWYTSKEEKLEITDSYKAKLKSIDCKHFDFGNGTCPFGTSCFYKHTVKPGSYAWNNCMEYSVKSNSYTWNSRTADKWMGGEGLGALIADDSGNEDLAFEDAAFLLMLMGLEESHDNDDDNVDNNDEDDFDELTAEQMAFLKRQLGYLSSDEQLFIF